MNKFKVGDHVESKFDSWNKDAKSRVVTQVDGDLVYYSKTLRRGEVEHHHCLSNMLRLVRCPGTPETFRKVFCAWTGQSERRRVSPIDQAHQDLLNTMKHWSDGLLNLDCVNRRIYELIAAVREES